MEAVAVVNAEDLSLAAEMLLPKFVAGQIEGTQDVLGGRSQHISVHAKERGGLAIDRLEDGTGFWVDEF